MKKRFLKLWSVLLSVCMLSANIAAMATETTDGGLSLEILSVQKLDDPYDSDAPDIDEARGGEAVAVTVGLRNGASESVNLTGVEFSLEYDGNYLEVENLDLEKNADLGWNLTAERLENSQIISVRGTGGAYEAGANPVCVTRFAFRVLAETEAGTADFTLSSAAVLDADGNLVEIPAKNRSLNILTRDVLQIAASDASINVGDTADVTISLSANPGIMGISMAVKYPSGLELTGADDAKVLKNGVFQDTFNSPFTLTFGDDLSTENDFSTGVIATLHFRVTDDGAAGSYAIEITDVVVIDVDMNDVAYAVTNGSITVSGAAPTACTVTFDPNGGTVSPSSITIVAGQAIGELPTPTREGYVFKGWFTAADGGEEVNASAQFTENTTLYAHWGGKTSGGGGSGGSSPGGDGGDSSSGGGGGGSSSAKSYSIAVEPSPNGKISAPTSAKNGHPVTVTVTPNSGYRIKSVSVVKSNGKSVSVKESNGKYTFTMPATDVTVSATFQATESGGVPQQHDIENTGATSVEESPFSDVSVSAQLYNDIKWANEKGLMKGYNDRTYQPNKAVSSITAVVVLARMTDSTLTNATSGLWYRNYQTWATQNNILPSGMRMQDTQFSRGEIARLLVSYLKFKGKDCTPPSKRAQFKDADRMLAEEEDAFQYLYSIGVFQGTDTLTMTPRGHVTRAQFAALIHRLSRFV